MRFAYADPPYLGCAEKHYGERHEAAGDYDTPEAHQRLIDKLVSEYSDGWALSCSSPSLRKLLPMCPDDVRVGAWVKPFAAFKANVTTAYAWEPVIWRGGRPRPRTEPTVRDWVAESITLQRGFPGAKPRVFSMWVLDLLNVQPGDTVDDLFPGSGAVGHAIAERLKQQPEPFGMFQPRPSSEGKTEASAETRRPANRSNPCSS